MKLLHLFSNWKWTGPAEPAVNLARALSNRHQVHFICGTPPKEGAEDDIFAHSRERGVEPLPGFHLRKHINLFNNFRDALKLRRLIRSEQYDLVHVHMANDHLLAGAANLGRGRKVPIVRTYYGADGPETDFRTSLLARRSTDGAIVISLAGKARLCNDLGFSEARAAVIPVGVDRSRFDGSRIDRAGARETLGLGEGDFVFGIVARMQRHRKFEVLLQAMKQAMEGEPRIKLVIVGRGTNMREVAVDPVKEMGLTDRILFPGYLRADAYVEALAAMDCAIFMVPGSDGSCRAVREKMAMGLPVIASNVPPLDEMIATGKDGLVIDLGVDSLREAILQITRNPEQTARMAERALEKGSTEFSLSGQADRVEEFYLKILEDRQG